MDVEVLKRMKKNYIVKPQDQPKGLEELREGLIQKKHWRIAYKVLEKGKVQNEMWYLDDKQCYTSDCLNTILSGAEMCKADTKEELKWVLEVIRWWIWVRLVLMEIAKEVFKEHS